MEIVRERVHMSHVLKAVTFVSEKYSQLKWSRAMYVRGMGTGYGLVSVSTGLVKGLGDSGVYYK